MPLGNGTEVGQNESALAAFAANRAALVDYAARIVGSRETAEDVVQEAWLRLDGAAAQPIDHPLAYLYRVVRNLALDLARRRSFERRHFCDDTEPADLGAAHSTPEEEAQHREELTIVLAALAELPARTRAAVEMHRFQGLKLKEIAAALGVSTALAHALVYDGLDHCRSRLRRRNRQ